MKCLHSTRTLVLSLWRTETVSVVRTRRGGVKGCRSGSRWEYREVSRRVKGGSFPDVMSRVSLGTESATPSSSSSSDYTQILCRTDRILLVALNGSPGSSTPSKEEENNTNFHHINRWTTFTTEWRAMVPSRAVWGLVTRFVCTNDSLTPYSFSFLSTLPLSVSTYRGVLLCVLEDPLRVKLCWHQGYATLDYKWKYCRGSLSVTVVYSFGSHFLIH